MTHVARDEARHWANFCEQSNLHEKYKQHKNVIIGILLKHKAAMRYAIISFDHKNKYHSYNT